VADRIVLEIEGDAQVEAALAEHKAYVMAETLASRWGRPAAGEFAVTQEQGDLNFTIRLARDSQGA
jgi:hypothetical protein